MTIREAHAEFLKYNDLPDTKRFTLWEAYKVYMREALRKLAFISKRKRQAKVDMLLKKINMAEILNKSHPSATQCSALMADGIELRNMLFLEH